MNEYLKIDIKNIKGIKEAHLELPITNGIFALVGENGSGKSTILQSFAQLIRPQNALFSLKYNDYFSDSNICFEGLEHRDNWLVENNRWKNSIIENRKYVKVSNGKTRLENNNIKLYGMYEGSLFVGTRFSDSTIVDNKFNEGSIDFERDLVEADKYVIENLSYILHGDKTHYTNLYRLKNRKLKESLNLKNLPYFILGNHDRVISQYRMSSGECLLISLLHFIYNSIIRQSLPLNIPILMLLDEIELALHPSAVSRFLDLLNDIVCKYKHVSVFLTTHAAEVIRKIEPSNIYKLENNDGVITYVNPCYPSYAIRDLYSHCGYDYLILCEDVLTKKVIEHVLQEENLTDSRLVHVCPVGGWRNVLKLHIELLQNNILGTSTNITSILDGDIEEDCGNEKQFSSIRKLFLPIPSIEKCFYNILYGDKYGKALKKKINDRFFTVKSIDELKSEFERTRNTVREEDNKKLYSHLKKDLLNRKIDENEFIANLLPILFEEIPIDEFAAQLKSIISKSYIH